MDYKQVPAKDIRISDIDETENTRVRIIGTLVSKEENTFVLDDTTGILKATSERGLNSSLNENSIVQAIGWVSGNRGEKQLRAELVIPLQGINIKLYRRVCDAIDK